MAQQRFTDIHRRAIWEAHGKRCIYCRQPLLFKELVIDHVIPLSVGGDEEQFARIRSSHALGADFAIEGDHNLAPACHPCNAEKHAHLLEPERAALILQIVRNRVPEVRRLKVQYEESAGVDSIILGVVTALDRGLISLNQIDDILRRYESNNPDGVLYQSLEFVGGVSVSRIRQADVEVLLDARVAVRSIPNWLDVVSSDGQKREVRTTREYREAIADGFVPSCNFMVKTATDFELPLGVFTAMEKAQPARISFLRDPRIGVIDLKYVSAGLLHSTHQYSKSQSLEDVRRDGNLRIISATSHSLHFEYNYMARMLFEVMRADLDGDGIEDILVYWYERAIEGTYGDGGTLVLTRRSQEALLDISELWPHRITPLDRFYGRTGVEGAELS
jgi:hypothetical protein